MKHNKWMRSMWAFMLIACLLLCGMPVTAFADESDEETQTEAFVIPEDAIYLSTPEDLLELAKNCISDAWSRDKVFVLKNDIDLTGVAFTSIPTFGGTFLGQGYTISGLRLTGEVTAQGFFRYLQRSAVVENLHIQGIVQPFGSNNLDIGGLVGINSGIIKNCAFTGTVSGTERIGGIAGRNKVSGTIEGCSTSGVVYGDHYIGGIAGENLGVIRSCVNHARVNTQVDHNSVSVGNVSVLSLESLTDKESISDATNIGGIAGTSSGVIRGCENRGNIGYEKMGYNVGGIAGSQIGYITECANYGTIKGSEGVGGIVGQFKPNVVLNFGENLVNKLTNQMIGMMGSMQGLMNSMEGMLGSMAIDEDSLEESMDILKDPKNWNRDSINAAINEMSSSFYDMYNGMVSMGSDMADQMSGMMGSMSGMMNTMERLNEGMNLKIIDVSKEDTPENTVSKVSSCANYGTIFGETYVGGIAGIADIEDTVAQEEAQGQFNLFADEAEIILRLVIRDCRNLATVSATKQYAGGIVGNMTIGAVFDGMNIGSVNALNADYVGGIAGTSETYIVNSFSRSILAGNQYVGGIAGFGTEVAGCYAITDIAAAAKFAGGILGYADPLPDEEAALILDNHYYLAGKNLGGIDGISYDGATAPMTIEEFLAVETLDDMFRTVSVRFQAEGHEDVVMTVKLGKTLPIAKIPVLDVGEHELYQWQLQKSVASQTLGMGQAEEILYVSKERLIRILFDQTYKAVFDAKNMVISSENKTEDGRSLALAVGAFDRDTILELTNIQQQEPTVNGVTVLETWQVDMADIGVEKLHYHMPEGIDPETIVLYVKDISGNWVQRSFAVEGSYMIFPFTHGESSFALEVLPAEELPAATITMAAGAAVLLLIAVAVIKKRRAKKKGAAGEQK